MFVTKAGGLVVQVSNVDYVDAVSRVNELGSHEPTKDKRYRYTSCCPVACALVRAGFRRSNVRVFGSTATIEGFGKYRVSKNGQHIVSDFDRINRIKRTGTVSLVKCK